MDCHYFHHMAENILLGIIFYDKNDSPPGYILHKLVRRGSYPTGTMSRQHPVGRPR
jgi:hypothetical protein